MASINYAELAKTAGSGFEPLPVPGPYDVEVTSAEYKEASTGSPMYRLELTVESGPHKGRKLFTNLVLTDKSAGVFFGRLRAFGLGDEFLATLPPQDAEPFIEQALVGRHAQVTVKHRTWQGQTQNEVVNVKATPGAAVASPAAPGAVPVTPAPASAPPNLPPGL